MRQITVVEPFKHGQLRDDRGREPGGMRSDRRNATRHDPGRRRGSCYGIRHLGSDHADSTSPYCDANNPSSTDCTTATFVDSHFGGCYSLGTCTVTTFFDHYSAGDQGLAYHEWKNASCDRGGNHGDIADTIVGPASTATPCVE